MGFKFIENSDGYYVDEEGQVLGKSGKVLKHCLNDKTGYLHVRVIINGKMKTKPIHRLVAETFLVKPSEKHEVNHIDGNKHNNHVENLEWVTRSENIKHAYKMGLQSKEQRERIAKIAGESSRESNGLRITLKHRDGRIFKFKSIRQAANELNLDLRTLSRVANKKKNYNSIKGFTVEVER